jgi:hypothetical protein
MTESERQAFILEATVDALNELTKAVVRHAESIDVAIAALGVVISNTIPHEQCVEIASRVEHIPEGELSRQFLVAIARVFREAAAQPASRH